MKLTWLADVLRAAGLVVVETRGWLTRGGEMSTVGGVIVHHTASRAGSGECPSLGIVTNGRPDLAGPLSQILLGRSGACYIVAAGKANHAGAGSYPTIQSSLVAGNSHLIGIEAENSGVGEPWSIQQMRAYSILCAALVKRCGLSEQQVISHYEWRKPVGAKIDCAGPWIGGGDWYSGGQWTPGNRTATANDFRVRVKARLDSWSDDMTQEEHDLLVQAAADGAYNRHLLDNIFRPKMDAIYIEVADEADRPPDQDTLGSRVVEIQKAVGRIEASP